MKRLFSLASLALLVALFALILTPGNASAHGHRQVGEYNFTVGFLDEPAYTGLKNGLDLTICKGHHCEYTVKDGQRVISNPAPEGAEETLKATVSMGSSEPMPLELSARFGQPGKFAAYFQPTKEGEYTFNITGTLDGQLINENFTSTKDGFSEVTNIAAYPAADESATETNALKDQVQAAQDSASLARNIGIAGTVIGVLGLLVAGIALARKPRAAASVSSEEKTAVDSLRG